MGILAWILRAYQVHGKTQDVGVLWTGIHVVIPCQKSNYQFLPENVIYISYISGVPMVSSPEIDSRYQKMKTGPKLTLPILELSFTILLTR
jgi:hypothetical protein